MLQIINLDGFEKSLCIYDGKKKLFGGQEIVVQSKDGMMLPLNMTFAGITIVYSTAEIRRKSGNSFEFLDAAGRCHLL